MAPTGLFLLRHCSEHHPCVLYFHVATKVMSASALKQPATVSVPKVGIPAGTSLVARPSDAKARMAAAVN